MHLPNYFLADQPPDASLSPALLTEACQTLRRNRERYLQPRSTESILQTIAEVAKAWLAPHSPWLSLLGERGPSMTGWSRESLQDGLGAYFRQLTPRALGALVAQELGHPQRLDRLVSNDGETFQGVATVARGPEVLGRWMGDESPVMALSAMLHGLLLRSAQVLHFPPGRSYLARLFAHSLRDAEPKLASCLEIAEWPAGSVALEDVLLAEVEAVVAHEAEEIQEPIRRRAPGRVTWLHRPPRVSAGYVAREVLGPHDEARVLEAAARDVVAWDQAGSWAPHVVFVETGGMLPPEGFAAGLAEELARWERKIPRGVVTEEDAATLGRHREFYRVRSQTGGNTRSWYSPESTVWSVVYEADPQFQPSPRHRFIHVRAVDTTQEFLHRAEPYRGRWSTLGLAADGLRAGELAEEFGAWGMARICPLGRMQQPPLTWRLDGRPSLGDLVRWTHWEQSP